MPSVLFVCTANQIRSPFAQEYFKLILSKRSIQGDWIVDSAGTWAFEDAPATPLAILVGHENEVSLEIHRSKGVTPQLLNSHDLILVMEHRHKEALCVEFPDICSRVYLLASMCGNLREIPDPVAGGIESYRMTAREIKDTIDEGLETIIKLTESPID